MTFDAPTAVILKHHRAARRITGTTVHIIPTLDAPECGRTGRHKHYVRCGRVFDCLSINGSGQPLTEHVVMMPGHDPEQYGRQLCVRCTASYLAARS
jgi:hypothetical protein